MLTLLILSLIPLEAVSVGISCWLGLNHNIGEHRISFSLSHIHLALLMYCKRKKKESLAKFSFS